jgi:choline dehydrogenase-like flavoprotein
MAAIDTNQSVEYDVIVIGGGTAGCVVTSRLHQRKPSLSILLLEAGEDLSKNPLVYSQYSGAILKGTDADWGYTSAPQRHLNGRVIYHQAGRGLSGSAALNNGELSNRPKAS